MSLQLTIEFSRGAELLLDKVKSHKVTLLTDDTPWNLHRLTKYISSNLLKEWPELFVQEETVHLIHSLSTNPSNPCIQIFLNYVYLLKPHVWYGSHMAYVSTKISLACN